MKINKNGVTIIEAEDRPGMSAREYLKSGLLLEDIRSFRRSEINRWGFDTQAGQHIIERQENGEVRNGR